MPHPHGTNDPIYRLSSLLDGSTTLFVSVTKASTYPRPTLCHVTFSSFFPISGYANNNKQICTSCLTHSYIWLMHPVLASLYFLCRLSVLYKKMIEKEKAAKVNVRGCIENAHIEAIPCIYEMSWCSNADDVPDYSFIEKVSRSFTPVSDIRVICIMFFTRKQDNHVKSPGDRINSACFYVLATRHFVLYPNIPTLRININIHHHIWIHPYRFSVIESLVSMTE